MENGSSGNSSGPVQGSNTAGAEGNVAPSGNAPKAAPSGPSKTVAATPSDGKVFPKSVPAEETQASAPPAKETAAEKKARLLKIKVDGKEQDLNIDEMDDNQLAMELQMARAARVRMQEAAELKKQFAEFQKAVKENPWETLKDPAFGLDLDRLAEERILQRYQEEMMPESERKLKEYERKVQEYEAREAAAKQAREQEIAQRAQAEMESRFLQEIERDFTAALETAKLPRTPQTLAIMAEIAQINLQHGLELTPQQLAYETRQRLEGQSRHFITGMKGEDLIKYLGDDVVREVLRYSVDKVKGKTNAPTEVPRLDEQPVQQQYQDDDEDVFSNKSATKRRQRALDAKQFWRKG